ncbi:MAG: PspC domain-containing protein [Actinomycetaceae bacterium]|nr:PspC domain-containing protein [Actinomycetaceae bacterium]
MDRLPLCRISPRLARARALPRPWLGGVCVGLSLHLRLDVRMVRVIFMALLTTGFGVLLYLWLWLTLPKNDPWVSAAAQNQAETRKGATTLVQKVDNEDDSRQLMKTLGFFALFFAAVTILDRVGLLHIPNPVWGIGAIGAGALMVWYQAKHMQDARKQWWVLLMGLPLVVAGVVKLMRPGGEHLLESATLGMGVAVAIVVVLVPVLVTLSGKLTATAGAEARASERADIAAHLHDSVLQTLALIRAQADHAEAVRRLARKQERELRTWLYDGESDRSPRYQHW